MDGADKVEADMNKALKKAGEGMQKGLSKKKGGGEKKGGSGSMVAAFIGICFLTFTASPPLGAAVAIFGGALLIMILAVAESMKDF